MQPPRQPVPAVQIDRREHRFEQEENALEAERDADGRAAPGEQQRVGVTAETEIVRGHHHRGKPMQARMMWKPRLDPIWARAGLTWSECSARLLSTCLASPSDLAAGCTTPSNLANRGRRLERGLAV